MKIQLSIFKLIILLLSFSVSANWHTHFEKLHSYDQRLIDINDEKITHLIFFDLWHSYQGQGDEDKVAALPKSFLQQSQQIWIQPELNVTKAQLAEFQQYFGQIKPLVLDSNFTLMRAFNIWQSPYHILIKQNKVLFKGDVTALSHFINQEHKPRLATDITMSNEIKSTITNTNRPNNHNKLAKPLRPNINDSAPTISGITLTGNKISLSSALAKLQHPKSFNLVFLDALCPMPQFPQCKTKIAKLNQLVATEPQQNWLAIVNSYYVDQALVKSFAKQYQLTIPLLFDHGNQIYQAYDVYASPYLIKIDHAGKIIYRSSQIQ